MVYMKKLEKRVMTMERSTTILTQFIEKGFSTKPCAFWFWETDAANMKDDQIREVMENCANKIGYGGFAIIPQKTNDYLSDTYFHKYRVALEKAEELGMHMCVYDENGFPSGAANGVFGEKYPEHILKRLDMLEWDYNGAQQVEITLDTEGTIMGIVLMNMDTKARTDVTSAYDNGKITLSIDEGNWKVMAFVCVTEGSPIVDYLSEESVKVFIDMTHEAYYREFAPYFGNVINTFFYDEPTMAGFEGPWIPGGRIVKGGRTWTPGFNDFYKDLYGEDPVLSYPALWYDVGEETEFLRRRLTECRSEMFNRSYIQQTADWCEERGVLLTGHTWEENFLNPSVTIGDLMKVFKYQQIPGIDSIAEYQCVKTTTKIVSSSAYNWDKPLVMCETFGAMPEDERLRHVFYKEMMDLYAKGINFMIPHAIWYGPEAYIKPELSYRGPYADILPDVMAYLTRLNSYLQGGRHVADIAMVYPIEDLHAKFNFAKLNDQCVPAYCNYTEVGEKLSCDYRYDFTYLHPEVLNEKCLVDAETKTLRLDNKVNFEDYRILVFPAMEMVSSATMMKAEEFYRKGGAVVFCGKVPNSGVDSQDTEAVKDVVNSLFAKGQIGNEVCMNKNLEGGVVCYIPENKMDELGKVIKEINSVFDVEIGHTDTLEDGTLTYIHKVKDGKDLYFFANSSINEIQTTVRVRGHKKLYCLDPHTEETSALDVTYGKAGAEEYTECILELAPERSLFYMGEDL